MSMQLSAPILKLLLLHPSDSTGRPLSFFFLLPYSGLQRTFALALNFLLASVSFPAVGVLMCSSIHVYYHMSVNDPNALVLVV